MCIAIFAKPGKSLTDEQIDNCWKVNDDGAGFAYVSGGQLRIVKELVDKDKFTRLYRRHLPHAVDSPMLIHFRIRTHGEVSIANTQPIRIDNDTAFIHNGMISCVPANAVHSDTVMFSRMILRKLRPGFHSNLKILDMIDKVVGWSKLVFLSSDKSWGIVNEKSGTWEDEIWYSNSSHKTPIVTICSTNEYMSKKNEGGWQGAWRGHYAGRTHRSHMDTVPTRYLPPPTTVAPVTIITSTGKYKGGVELEHIPGMSCDGCNRDLNVGMIWYEYYNKNMVCSMCKKDWEECGIQPTASGRVVPSKGDSDNDQLSEIARAYGCAL